jgi:hypothetical protein
MELARAKYSGVKGHEGGRLEEMRAEGMCPIARTPGCVRLRRENVSRKMGGCPREGQKSMQERFAALRGQFDRAMTKTIY